MKNLKRVLALVTVLSMLLSVNAFAADGDEGEEEPEAVVVVISTNEESTEDDKSVTIPAEDDNGAAVMEAVKDIHDAIDNAADGSTVTITVGDGEGTLTNDGKGVLEENCENDEDEIELATLLSKETWTDEEKQFLIDTYSYDNDELIISKQLDKLMASGAAGDFIVGQNILETPESTSAVVQITTNGTLSSVGIHNATIAAPSSYLDAGERGKLIINGGDYIGEQGACVINVANGTVQIENGSFKGSVLVTGRLEDANGYIPVRGGALIINGGTFSQYTIETDGATKLAEQYGTDHAFSSYMVGFKNTATEGTVQISGGSFDKIDTLKDSYLVTDAESGLETILVYQRNGASDNMYTAVARSSLVDTYDLTAHETEGQATYYTITLKVVNEETGEEEIIEAPVYFYDDSSDDSSDDDTPAAPVTQTIEEEATPLAALPEAFTADDVASLAVDLGLAETVESYDFVAETTAETVSSVIESLTAGNENADAAAILTDAGITPESVVSREQFATVIYALAGTAGFDMTARADLAEKFTDADAVSAFAQEALEWAVEAGIYRGTSQTTLDPKSTLTYDQLILVVSRYLAMLNAQ